MKKDTQEAEPVESIEASVSAALDAAEEIDDETEEQETKAESTVTEDAEQTADEATGDAEQGVSDGDGDELAESEDDRELQADDETDDKVGDKSDGEDGDEDNLADSEGEGADKLTAPEHWAAQDRELFNGQTREAKEWLLERHKSMEGDYTRKSQDIASDQRQFTAIKEALAPIEQDFASSGLDQAGAVRKLAAVHQALKTDGRSAIFNLAQTYGIDLS